jgi:hypothetical protein
MGASYSPWDILGLSSNADPQDIVSTYRSLVWRFHPDANPQLDLSRSNEAMERLNWAVEELKRNLDGWRLKAPRRTPWPSILLDSRLRPIFQFSPRALAIPQLEVTPMAIKLAAGERAVLAARSPHVVPEAIRVRFPVSLNVRRLRLVQNAAHFELALDQAGALQILDSELKMARLDIAADGVPTVEVFVSLGRLEPMRTSSSETDWVMRRLRGAERPPR